MCAFSHIQVSASRGPTNPAGCYLHFTTAHSRVALTWETCVLFGRLGGMWRPSLIIWGYTAFQLSIAFTSCCSVFARSGEGWYRTPST